MPENFVLVIFNNDDVKLSIEYVLEKLKDDDFFIIQKFIEKVSFYRVIFTRCIDDNAPYVVINTDKSLTTDLVTSGKNPLWRLLYT